MSNAESDTGDTNTDTNPDAERNADAGSVYGRSEL